MVIPDAVTLPAGLADKTFTFSQASASTEWIVTHGLGKFPAVSIRNDSNEEMEAGIVHININEFRVYFNNATSGIVVCN